MYSAGNQECHKFGSLYLRKCDYILDPADNQECFLGRMLKTIDRPKEPSLEIFDFIQEVKNRALKIAAKFTLRMK